MFLRPNHRSKNGKDHTYWSLVETVRTPDGRRQKTLWHLGELNSTAQAQVPASANDPEVARVVLHKARLERTRQFGACFLGLELWKRPALDSFLERTMDGAPAYVPWSRVAALLAINRLCAPGSELAIEQRWYPSTALDDLLAIEEGRSTTRA
jgi:hypothetical protein